MRILSLIIFCLSVALSSAQERDRVKELMDRTRAKLYDSIARPPDFQTERDRLDLLANRSIRNELGLGVKEWSEVQRIRRDALAELTRITDQYLRTYPRPFILPIVEETLKKEEDEKVSKILTAAQLERLGQLVHHVEIAYVGLPMSIAEGNLGREIGIYENQISRIKTEGAKIVDESTVWLSKIRLKAHHDVLSLLPAEAQFKAEKLLGPYFEVGSWTDSVRDYRLTKKEELAYDKNKLSVSPPEIRAIIQATPIQLLIFLCHIEVWRELKLKPEQVASINEARTRAENGVDVSEVLNELLLPDQLDRLNQIFYYMELKLDGYATALTAGSIGKELGVLSESAMTLGTEIQNLETQYEQQCQAVQQQTYNRILRLLSSEQRRKAEVLLGDYFEYVDGTIATRKESRELYLRSNTGFK